jgi:CheY-like chemotaxis protein
MGYWVLYHLPLKDFRAYKVGTNIQQGMEIPEGAPKSVVEMIFVYKVNGVNKNFTEKDLMAIPAGATFVERIDKVITEGYKPPIHDFTMELDGSDYKDELLQEPKLLMFVAYDLPKADKKGLEILEGIHQKAKAKGYKVIAMTASDQTQIDKTKKEFGCTFDFYFCDGTTLKTIERANPSIVILEKGTITQKVHYNDAALLKF